MKKFNPTQAVWGNDIFVKAVRQLAEQIYESEHRMGNPRMPTWAEGVPSVYGYGCINEAANRLGWAHENEIKTKEVIK